MSAGPPPRPLRLVSLSGGGYRAALYHAGVLRALRCADLLSPQDDRLWVGAVSGGALPAMVWNEFLSRHPFAGKTSIDMEQLPERLLLELVEGSPSFGGRFNWTIRRPIPPLAWASYVERWWRHVHSQIGGISKATMTPPVTFLIETVDFMTGKLFAFDGECMNTPNGRSTLPRSFVLYGSGAGLESFDWPVGRALVAATAFPVFMAAIRSKIGLGQTRLQAEFVDAGLVDNQGLFLLLGLLEDTAPAGSWWLFSTASAPLKVPTASAGALYIGPTKRRLSWVDRIFRLTGELAQPLFVDWLLNGAGARQFGVDAFGTLIGHHPPSDPLWRPQPQRADDPHWIASVPTALKPLARRDSLSIYALGAQTASLGLADRGLMTTPQRSQLEEFVKGLN